MTVNANPYPIFRIKNTSLIKVPVLFVLLNRDEGLSVQAHSNENIYKLKIFMFFEIISK